MESDRLIESLEKSMQELVKNKLSAEEELDRTKKLLDEHEDTIYDLETMLTKEKKQGTFKMMKMASTILIYQKRSKK